MDDDFFFRSFVAMKFATFIKYLMGFIVKVIDHKYSIAVLRNYLLCDRGVVCALMLCF